MLKILFFILFVNASAFAGIFEVQWGCPKTYVQVSFNDQGKLQFKPDVLNGKFKSGNAEETAACIEDFQKKIQETFQVYQTKNCQSSKEDLCIVSVDYINLKVVDKIQSSNVMKKFPGLKISTPVTVISGKPETKPEVKPEIKPDVKPNDQRDSAATPEAFLKEKIAKKEIDPKNLSQSFQFKNKSYKVSDFDKVVGEQIENVFSGMNREEAKQFAQNYMVAKSEAIKATAPSEQRTQVLNNLNQMFGYIYGDKGAEELAKILECKPEDDLKPITDILTNLEDTKKVEKCKDLAPGEHKVFKKESSDYYGTGHYLLKRTKEGNYQAVISVNFKTGGGAVSPQDMMERAKGCLDNASPYFKGPDGKKLQFSVLTPSESEKLPDDERPQPYDVKIEPVGYGTNAGAYAQDVNCGTITHEMLHLLGLCDEYEENRPQYGNMWNCRVVTKVPSIMRDTRVYDQALPKATSCNCTSQTCSSIMKGADENIKKLYTGQSGYDIIDYKFRNAYCKEDYINGAAKNLKDPSKALAILSESSNELVLESRFVSQSTVAPHYKVLRSKITCTCPAGNADCISQKSRIVELTNKESVKDACPQGTTLIGNNAFKGKAGVAMEGDVMNLVSTPKLPSLLQPQQFNKILAGPCTGKGADGYIECADFAYKSDQSGPCNVPEKCRDDKYYMGSQQ